MTLFPMALCRGRSVPVIAVLGVLTAGGAMIDSARAQASRGDFREALETEILDRARGLFWTGDYEDCVKLCASALSSGRDGFYLMDLTIRSLVATGEREEALKSYLEMRENAAPDNIALLMAGHRVCKSVGKNDEAAGILREVNRLARERPRSELAPEELVALGEAAYLLGADPKQVMSAFFQEARKKETQYGWSHLAAGRLALEKRDFALAADAFRGGIKAFPADPDMLAGLAAAYSPSDRKQSNELLERALKLNPRHVDSLLLKAEHLIDSEQYPEADATLEAVLGIDARNQRAWALQAVLYHFEGDRKREENARVQALKTWPENPEVDHLIGRIISQKRRFEEGAEYQKAALAVDPGYPPAKMQLALDLLRLGREEEAWALAEEARAEDEYNVLAFNLMTLRDQLNEYATIITEDFILRLPKKEAAIYGDRALEILTEAKAALCDKYGLRLDAPVLVEFFPEQQDFAVRTFGVPGGGGILGACFGSVITMNSPGGLAHGTNNWEATLWHEFCHVVTLSLTKNKMPRWFSEGISVYEEWQRDTTWGERLTPRYRTMILEEDALRPVSEISSMFMNPESGEQLMFAYLESALAVDFMIRRYGLDKVRALLNALGQGTSMEDAMERHMDSLERLDAEFEAFVRDLATDLGPQVDWSDAGIDLLDPEETAAFVKEHPNHFQALKAHVLHQLDAGKWKEARQSAQDLVRLYPGDVEEENGYLLLARAHRELEDRAGEIRALEELASKSCEAAPAYLRLMSLAMEQEDWEKAEANAMRQLSVNPFIARTHYCLGRACEARQHRECAARAYEKALMLGADRPSEVRFRVARLLRESDPEAARRHVLDALVEAPRYREAQRLLVELAEGPGSAVDSPQPEVRRTK